MRKGALVLALLCLLAPSLPAQAPSIIGADSLDSLLGKVVEVRTSGGGDFRGTLFNLLEDRVEILGAEGVITEISRAAILSVEAIDLTRDRALYFQDSASNRLVVMPTGFGMEKGEFHVAAQEIIIITTSYGLSENFSLWGGISIPGALVNLRWSTGLGEGRALSLGSFLGVSWLQAAGIALPYAIASFGHPNSNLTLGLGLPFAWEPEGGARPVGVVGAIGGKAIVSATTSIVTENWVIAMSDGWTWSRLDVLVLPTAVFRIASERLSWDIGAIAPISVFQGRVELGETEGIHVGGLGGGTIIPLPILSITYRVN
ncbi:MAG: hypothetical protein WCL50_01555 [Spirochaetota bacterium]